MSCIDCIKDLENLLEAWDTLVMLTNDPEATEESIEEAYRNYDAIAEGVAVKNGHPAGKPRRRP
jgi:hypothetical protein